MLDKIDALEAKYRELEQRLADPEVLGKPSELAQVASAHNALSPIIAKGEEYRSAAHQIADAESLLESETDPEMRELASQELAEGNDLITKLEHELKVLLLPKDEYDERNVILEIRAGTGGDEAALFAADLYRMYTRYAETKKWKVEELTRSEIGIGGLKEVSAAITGANVYQTMKFESGVHRVQRVPATEASGRIHTSAATVAVMPEAEEVDVNIPEKDLRIDVYRSSGHGGQSVNTTDSAVRITHLPTNLVVTCQDEKSQHKNKAKALKVLRARLLQAEQERRDAERREEKRSMVGSGDRSERIRTYNFPENRITDHRIKLTLYRLAEAMEGEISELSEALTLADQEVKMAAL